MLSKRFYTALSALLLMVCICRPAFGMQLIGNECESVPFAVDLDRETTGHILYRGHAQYGRVWGDGYVITPDFCFRLEPTAYLGYHDTEGIEIRLDLVYEDDDETSAIVETVKVVRGQDISFDEYYPFFSDFNKDALDSRGKLYSDVYNRALRMTVRYHSSEYSIWFLVCDEADYQSFFELADGAGADV